MLQSERVLSQGGGGILEWRIFFHPGIRNFFVFLGNGIGNFDEKDLNCAEHKYMNNSPPNY